MTTKINATQQVRSGTVGPTELANTAVTPGEYGDASNVPVITIDADGRVTAASEIAVSGGGSISDGDKGDITVASSGTVWTVDNNVITNAKAADMATDTIKGRATASTGDPEDLTALPFAFTGDVTRAADSNAQVIPNDTVSYPKMQNVSAASKLLGRGSAGGSGDVEEITLGTGLTMTATTLSSSGGSGGEAAHSTMWNDEAQNTVGNAFAVSIDANQRYGMFAQQNPAANGDTFINQFAIAAGTYNLAILGVEGAEKGIVDWYIDDVLIIAGQDWYNASTPTYNIKKVTGSLVITSGAHVLKGVVNGKHASSAGYQVLLTKYWFYP